MMTPMLFRPSLFLSFVLVAASLFGCSTSFHAVRTGTLSPEVQRIAAADGSFTLTPGAEFAVPYAAGPASPRICTAESTDIPAEAFEVGRRVEVTVEGRAEPLHGLLVFCDVPDSATGPGSRSYLVRIPPDFVAATSGGRVSVVFEPAGARGGSREYKGWILWLAEYPLR